MKIFSWNVNGIRAILKNGFMDFMETYQPDILCLQEVRAEPDQVNLSLTGYQTFWNCAQRKGYSGTAIFTKKTPKNVQYGIGIDKHDKEGRVVTADMNTFYLLSVYTPNAQRGLTRLDYRTKEWDPDFLNYIKNLEKEKPVVFCGDLNCAHKEIDLANPKSNERNAGFTIEERTEFDKYIQNGFIDSFREFQKEGGYYTWWSYFGKAREKNIGWRIDYFLLSSSLKKKLKDAQIYANVMGSDHCPVSIELK